MRLGVCLRVSSSARADYFRGQNRDFRRASRSHSPVRLVSWDFG